MNSQLLSQARQLSMEDQLDLVDAIWRDIAGNDAVPVTDVQKTELDSRFGDHAADPHDVLAWADVKTAALARIGR
ncbi:MAG: addiction module protein [Panacagrimonas sp.]